MSFYSFLSSLLISVLCGFFIGLERQFAKKDAGLRTSILVSLGATLYVLISSMLPEHGDPTRIVSQVVTGVGFLGAGLIFKDKNNIHGLTTAATIWCIAAVGSLVGFGYFLEAIMASLIIVIINWCLKFLEKWLQNQK